MYAGASAQYAAYAIGIASIVADGGPATLPHIAPSLPSDVLALAQIHVPLLQMPASAVRGKWLHRLPRENAGLTESHKHLLQAIASVESSIVAFNEPETVAEQDVAYILEADFPAALHHYATFCVFALAIMSAPGD